MKPPPFPFCSVTQQHGGEEGASGRTGRKTGAALSSSAMAPKETGYKAAQDATRLPNGQILPNIPPNSLFCVTLPASRMGRFCQILPLHSFFCVTLPTSRTGRLCQTYHHTLSFVLPYPLPERADSAKRTTTLILLRYPTRFPNGQTLSNVSPHSFLFVTLPASVTGRLGQKYHHTLSFCATLPVSRLGRIRQTRHNTLSFVFRYPLPEWADSAKRTTLFLLRSHV
jgi:hypothetical protein